MPQFFTVAIKAIIVQDNKALVLKKVRTSDDAPYWDLPGGRMEAGESLQAAMKRELEEELGFTGQFDLEEVEGVNLRETKSEDGNELLFVYFKIETDSLKPVLSDEHSAFIWVDENTLDELKKDGPLFSSQEDALRRALLD